MEAGDSIAINRAYLDHLLVEGRIVGASHPDTHITLFGRAFDTPVMTAALSHLKAGMAALAESAKLAGAACCVGMGPAEELDAVLSTGAGVIKIIKPYADKDEIYRRMERAKSGGAIAVGMDVEHAVNVHDDRDSLVAGYQMKLPAIDELRAYVRDAGLPFVIKGAMSVRDAAACADMGCAGVILGHHNGLLRYAVPPASLIPDIRAAVGRSLTVICDGGMRDGFDVFKALALGADAVSVGRALMGPLDEQGPEGAAAVIRGMTDEVKAMMCRTGFARLEDIDSSVLHRMTW